LEIITKTPFHSKSSACIGKIKLEHGLYFVIPTTDKPGEASTFVIRMSSAAKYGAQLLGPADIKLLPTSSSSSNFQHFLT
jgi:hypothetical protein